MKIGLISDTHGLLRPEALAALQGCDRIVHAGDIGKPQILEALAALAPLTQVPGNNDEGFDWAAGMPTHVQLQLPGVGLYLTHDIADLPSPLPEGINVVVTGHSHKPLVRELDGVLYINPGSAGPRRFKLPITCAILHADASGLRVEAITLVPAT